MSIREKLQNKLDNLTKPKGSLGLLEKIAVKLGVIQNTVNIQIKSRGTLVFAADHGVVENGISAFPKEVTVQMVKNFLNNGAAVNILSKFVDSKVFVIDAGVDYDFPSDLKVINNKLQKSSGNFYKDLAMSVESAKKNVEKGKQIAKKLIIENNFDIIAIGEMGIGNTTSATAITCHICDLDPFKATGKGTGIDDKTLFLKQKIISEVITGSKDIKNPYEILSKMGGLEIAQMAGAILAAKETGIAVVIDGVICTAAALIAFLIDNEIENFMFAGHLSEEACHKYALEYLGLTPILRFDMRLGEGTGAVLAFNIIDASTKIINEMATFETAGVSTQNE